LGFFSGLNGIGRGDGSDLSLEICQGKNTKDPVFFLQQLNSGRK